MLRVVSCLTTQHDWRLVILAGAVCFLTSIAAITLFHRALATRDRIRLLWLTTTGVAAGYGIWATHFIAMLAFSPGLATSYNLPLTLASLLAAALVTGAGFGLAAAIQASWAAPAGGAIVGLGIGVMHYTGMAAFEVPGHIGWAADLVAASILFGGVFGIAAMRLALRSNGLQTLLLSAILLTLAIVSHHFTAMGAVEIAPDSSVSVAALSLSPNALAAAIASAAVAVAVLGVSLVAALGASSRQQLIEISDAEITKHAERLEAALTNMSQGLCLFDQDQRIVVANRQYAEMYGLKQEQIKPGTTLREILEMRIDAGIYGDIDKEAYIAAGIAGFPKEVTEVLHLADGRFIAVRRRPIADGGLISTHADITERELLHEKIERQNHLLQENDEQLRAQNLQLDAALNNMSQGLCMFDADQRLVVCNDRYLKMHGLSREDLKAGCSLREVLLLRSNSGTFPGDPDIYCRELTSAIARGETMRATFELGDGRVISVVSQPMEHGGFVVTHEDITERRSAEARIAHLAHYDPLTNLPNRVALHERLEQAVEAMKKGGSAFAVLLLDLDRFKEINDSYGHPFGDQLLNAVALRLGKCIRESDTISRLGGDEFAIIQKAAHPEVDSVTLAKRIQHVLEEPFSIGDQHHVLIGASVGIAIAPADGDNPDVLLKNVDLALYRAKADLTGSYHLFEPELDRRMQERRALETDLRNALLTGQFAVHYQPLVNLERNEVCGFEALLRWNHPERGNVPPGDFIPLAEETGLIIPLGEWVLRQACSDAAAWPDQTKIAINISTVQFRARNLAEIVMRTLATTGLAPQRLELEITESVMMEDEEAAFRTLRQLHDIGVRIALDDFGTGYSSLSNLRKFPFDKIKIDRSFVSDLSRVNVDAIALIRAVAQLGLNLGMETTAEGIETQEQLAYVREEGCTEVQGFYICPPGPAKEIEALVLDKHRRVVSAA